MSDKIYTPLRFLKQTRPTIDDMADTFSRYEPGFAGSELESQLRSLTPYDLLDLCCNENFMKLSYVGKTDFISRINQFFIKYYCRPDCYEIFKETPETFIRDCMAMSCVCDIWSTNKQVYLPDEDFYRALCGTDTATIYPNLLRRLPYNCFYIDFSNIKSEDMEGCFVLVQITDSDFTFLLMQTDGELFYPAYHKYSIDAFEKINGEPKYDLTKDFIKSVSPDRMTTSKSEFLDEKHRGLSFDNSEYPNKVIFIVQFLTYLVSSAPDVNESPVTKRTYKPSSVIKNKFSEVRQWEVGYTYGKTIRGLPLHEKRNTDSNTHGESFGGIRRPPRPHSRCVHWQRYWTGEGRKCLELKWIAPTFVGGKSADIATIHKVKS